MYPRSVRNSASGRYNPCVPASPGAHLQGVCYHYRRIERTDLKRGWDELVAKRVRRFGADLTGHRDTDLRCLGKNRERRYFDGDGDCFDLSADTAWAKLDGYVQLVPGTSAGAEHPISLDHSVAVRYLTGPLHVTIACPDVPTNRDSRERVSPSVPRTKGHRLSKRARRGTDKHRVRRVPNRIKDKGNRAKGFSAARGEREDRGSRCPASEAIRVRHSYFWVKGADAQRSPCALLQAPLAGLTAYCC